MSSGDGRIHNTISRRRVLQTLGAGTAAGLAGCGEDGGNGDGNGDGNGGGNGGGSGDLGERVPTISMEYWSNLGGQTTIMENASPVIQENVQNRLGIDLEVVPVEFTTQINNTIQDKRTHHVGFWYHTSTPDRLDPEEMTRRYSADWAGGNGQANPANYADCEYTDSAAGQSTAPDEDTRRELVFDAHEKYSEDLVSLPVFPTLLAGAIRTDEVEPGGVGSAGVVRTNPYYLIKSETDRDQLGVVDTPVAMETTNFPIIDSSAAQAIWNHVVHSTLTEYDENFELQNVLAEDYTVEEDATRITVTLKDATFHNGDPITAEDVRFTYKQLWDNPGVYPQAASPNYEEINVVDEKTAEFVMEEPFLALVQKVWPRWGIFHRDTWVEGGAEENPEEFEMEEVVGSGPWAMREFSTGESMDLVPHDGHPVHSPGHAIFLQALRNQQTAFQAFQNNEVQMAPNLDPGIAGRIEDQMSDVAEVFQQPGFMSFHNYPQHSWSPGQFREFREAWGQAINRREAVDIALRGAVDLELYATPMSLEHPFRPPEDRLTQMAPPEGDEEAARQALEEAGWGWDDDGRLHYPADKDLSPQWPEEEEPDPSEFPCISEEGDYLPPDQR